MKSLAKRLFPHPVLMKSNDDFKDSEFNVKIGLNYDSSNSCWIFEVDYDLNNNDLLELIKQNKIAVALHFECGSTRYRNKWISENGTPIKTVICDSYIKLQGEYAVILVAMEDIASYREASFHNDYDNVEFKISKGDILGIGDFGVVSFNTDMDPVSIFEFNHKPEISSGLFEVEYQQQNIIVNLSSSLHKEYMALKENRRLWPVLNSMLILPALNETIHFIIELYEEDDDTYEDAYWYIQISKKAKELKIDFKNLESTKLFAAQKILSKMVEEALVNLNAEIEGEDSDS